MKLPPLRKFPERNSFDLADPFPGNSQQLPDFFEGDAAFVGDVQNTRGFWTVCEGSGFHVVGAFVPGTRTSFVDTPRQTISADLRSKGQVNLFLFVFAHEGHLKSLHQKKLFRCKSVGMADEEEDLESYWATVRKHPSVPDQVTIGQKYERAMRIETKAEAEREFERLVEHTMRAFGRTRQDAEKVERTNLGYYSGYFGVEVQKRVEHLYGAVHPVFGPVSNQKQLTANEIFQLGVRLGERASRNEPVFCEHANENPSQCPCDPGCYCRDNTCRGR